MPTIRQFEYLVAVADTLHFGKAAENSNVSQPGLSQQLQQLEFRLGATLFIRSGRSVVITPIGEKVVEKARTLLQNLSDIHDVARNESKDISGHYRLGITPTLGPYLLPATRKALVEEIPNVELSITEALPDRSLDALTRHELDFVIATLPSKQDGIELVPLFEEPLHIIGSRDHAIFAVDGAATRDMKGAQIYSLDLRHPLALVTKAVCEEFGATLIAEYQGTNLDNLRKMAATGTCFALLPELYLLSENNDQSQVRILKLTDWSLSRKFYGVWRKGCPAERNIKTIAKIIRQTALKELQAGFGY
ncbi:Hydrogen peroxide-inducible protein activator [Alteripontixanthobacter maritimus]|uniref:Hydrogen peroxide-inducible protein activator n=1 Tax=Alteripontixanthobacter maritimus TaxID=2161824 RepID=A0A369Q390_9SPHN|nr:LysR substrate-binding domain-containing protein [Alteripontixanthobacter maritimus]RDC58930.1 Hydrogen peroxide-inducible protein activator [Alteripontixanthobacter maritimus]